jgi:hypothetical protein
MHARNAWKKKEAHACKGEALDCFPKGNHEGFFLSCKDFNKPDYLQGLRKPVGLCAAKRAIQGSKRAALCSLRIGNQIFHFKSIQGPKRAALQTLQLILQSDKN